MFWFVDCGYWGRLRKVTFDPVSDAQMLKHLSSDGMKPHIQEAGWTAKDILRYVEHFDGEFVALEECLNTGLDCKFF